MSGSGNEMILASAGTGKTYALSSRYLRLLVDGVAPQSILATTFTRKAAGEILDRIVQRLAAAALDEETARKTAEDVGRPGTERARFGELLVTLSANLNNLQVETLDAFFGQVARSFSLDLGLPPDWEIGEDDEMNRYQNLAIGRSLSRKNVRRFVYDLARGEAKRGISSLIRNTVEDLYGIYRETLDTGRLRAWEGLPEMPTLPEARIEELYQELRQIEPEEPKTHQKAFLKDLQLIADRDWMKFPISNLAGAIGRGSSEYYRRPIQPEIVERLTPLVHHAVARYLNVLSEQTRAARGFLERFHEEFETVKMAQATLRFDDVCYLAQRLFSDYSAGQLAYRMDKQINHLLLDEFQDTSIEQWQVLRPIAEQTCRTGPNRSFFCVGDVKQAIYGWRGGVAEIFEVVQQEFGDTLDQPAELNKSWRSAGVIIQTVNQVFTGMTRHQGFEDNHFAIESWRQRFTPHQTWFPDWPGYAVVEKTLDGENHEARAATRIRELTEQHPDKTIGVLARTNKKVASLIFELGRAGVRASEEGGNPLTDSAAVNLVLAGLRLIDHPDDSVARFQVLNSPLATCFDLQPETWKKGSSGCRDASGTFRQMLVDHGYGALISGWAGILEPSCTEREWFRLNQLIERGFRISVADHPRTRDFVAWIEQARVPDPVVAPVRVMTIHKSKGLEFDIVVLPELDFSGSRTPTYIVGRDRPTSPIQLVSRYLDSVKQSWLPPEFQAAFQKNAENRIHDMISTLYVALTRARHGLYMLVPPKTKASSRNAAGLVLAALEEDPRSGPNGSSQRVLWQLGDPDWTQVPDSQAIPAPPAARPPRGKLRFAPGHSNRNLPRESPSSREGGTRVHLGRLLQLEDNQDARWQGTLIHACFEQVTWLDEWTMDETILRARLSRVEGVTAAAIHSAVGEFRRMIGQPGVRELLSKSQYASDLFDSWDAIEVCTERPFAVRIDDRILTGFVDRLVMLYRNGRVEAADVIDFKTDDLPAGDPEALARRTDIYRPQLQAYRDATARLLGLPVERVSARLIYAAIDRHVQID